MFVGVLAMQRAKESPDMVLRKFAQNFACTGKVNFQNRKHNIWQQFQATTHSGVATAHTSIYLHLPVLDDYINRASRDLVKHSTGRTQLLQGWNI